MGKSGSGKNVALVAVGQILLTKKPKKKKNIAAVAGPRARPTTAPVSVKKQCHTHPNIINICELQL
jgi:hypothetical protein